MLTSVELFAGAGGLGLGLSLAGFESRGVLEWDRWACDTIRQNQRRGHPLVAQWPLHEGDVRNFDYSGITDAIDVVSGGPPCQPFSMGGKHRAHEDARDMFPASVDVIRRLRPRAFIVENVKGLMRATFANYREYITLQLEFPEIVRRGSEEWPDHLRRLQKEKTSGQRRGLSYNVVVHLANAANYGVPQKRERVFFVGFRDDLDVRWSFPEETHSHEALLVDQLVTGDYWDRHNVARKNRPEVSNALTKRAVALRQQNFRATDDRRPWRTVRDALIGLPDPEANPTAARLIHDHRFQPGARYYKGHTGSPLDQPAKTLKAGDHGVPGGENALVRPDGTRRYFTVRESARLQTFPDGYVFHGAWSECMRQLGNAVPVVLAHTVARSVATKLLELDLLKTIEQGRPS